MSTIKTLTVCMLLVLLGALAHAQSPEWAWANKAGGNNVEDYAYVARDGMGSTFVTGVFSGTTVIGNSSLVSVGERDCFVSKMDANGNWLWSRRLGGVQTEYVSAIKVDANSNVYITGRFSSPTVYFGNISLTNTQESTIYTDVFVAKINCDGDWLWAVKGGGSSMDNAWGLDLDPLGNIYVTGSIGRYASFGSYAMGNVGGQYDTFVAKLDQNGIWLWARKAGGGDLDDGYGIQTDSAGNCYVVGTYKSGTINFYHDAVNNYFTYYLTNLSGGYGGNTDAYVAKLDPEGNWLWVQQCGGPGTDGGQAIDVDNDGFVYVTGYFQGMGCFGNTSLISLGVLDVYVAKLSNVDGSWSWAIKGGGSGVDMGKAIRSDNVGNLHLVGEAYLGTAYFGNLSITAPTNTKDAFYAKIDCSGGSGIWINAKKIGGVGVDDCHGISIQPSGEITLSGSFNGSITVGSTQLTSSGASDIFVAKLNDKSLKLLGPNGGEVYAANQVDPITISWNSTTIQEVRLYYRLSDLDPWIPLNGGNSVAAVDGMNQFAWTGVPTIDSESVRVRVEDASNSSLSCESIGCFSILTPLAAPTGVSVGPDPTNYWNTKISWNMVDMTINGHHIIPSEYRVYYSTIGDSGNFIHLGTIPVTAPPANRYEYIHQNATGAGYFYRIKAVLY